MKNISDSQTALTNYGIYTLSYPTSISGLIISSTDNYDTIAVSTSGIVSAIVLPPVATNVGKEFIILKNDVGSGIVTVDAYGSELIEEYTTPYNLRYNREAITVKSMGSYWRVKEYNGREKTYIAGNTYNGVNISITGWAAVTTSFGVFIPYKTVDGRYRLTFNFDIHLASSGSGNITISGVIFKNYTSTLGGQSVNANTIKPGIDFYPVKYAYAAENSSNIVINNTDGNVGELSCSGDVELKSLPTWCDNI